jgi:hypothetical protein
MGECAVGADLRVGPCYIDKGDGLEKGEHVPKNRGQAVSPLRNNVTGNEVEKGECAVGADLRVSPCNIDKGDGLEKGEHVPKNRGQAGSPLPINGGVEKTKRINTSQKPTCVCPKGVRVGPSVLRRA